MAQPVDTSISHLGFRCIVRAIYGPDSIEPPSYGGSKQDAS